MTIAALVLGLIVASVPGLDERPPFDQPESTPGVVEIGLTEGVASYYEGSRGFHGIAHIAVQDGRWTGRINRTIEVCVRGHGCHTLPVVDYCQCYRGTDKERIVDLSIEAVRLFNLDTSRGIWPVTLRETE